MIKKVLILGGGISKERPISIQTAKAVMRALKKKNYEAIICEPDGNLTKIIKRFKPDVVFNALHGTFGEDGYIQTILENEKMKYTHSGVLASAIAMDKEISKKIFLKNNILTPKYMKYNFSNNSYSKKNLISIVGKKLNFPVVIKPINEGSSVHVYICNRKNLIKNIKKLSHYREILIEAFIAGREIQVAIMGKKKLGAIELRPKRKFYDYEAKYNSKAKTKHIIPVELSKNNLNKIMNIAFKVHKLIGCKGVTRSDFKFNQNKFYLLEINTQPGMTKLSLVPEIAEYKGISFVNLIEWIVKDASIKR
jgi:D-alanine-D-alanine ligase